jgi:hypothetical protein
MARKQCIAWNDPLLHLLALLAILASVTLVLDHRAGGSIAKVGHPANCHACSACSLEAMASRDRYLLQTGAMEDVGRSE